MSENPSAATPTDEGRQVGTDRVKRGMAQMLKGGVIMEIGRAHV